MIKVVEILAKIVLIVVVVGALNCCGQALNQALS